MPYAVVDEARDQRAAVDVLFQLNLVAPGARRRQPGLMHRQVLLAFVGGVDEDDEASDVEDEALPAGTPTAAAAHNLAGLGDELDDEALPAAPPAPPLPPTRRAPPRRTAPPPGAFAARRPAAHGQGISPLKTKKAKKPAGRAGRRK